MPQDAAKNGPRDAARYVRRLSQAFGRCRDTAAAYGACLKDKMDAVAHKECEPHFQKLKQCMRQQLRSAGRG